MNGETSAEVDNDDIDAHPVFGEYIASESAAVAAESGPVIEAPAIVADMALLETFNWKIRHNSVGKFPNGTTKEGRLVDKFTGADVVCFGNDIGEITGKLCDLAAQAQERENARQAKKKKS